MLSKRAGHTRSDITHDRIDSLSYGIIITSTENMLRSSLTETSFFHGHSFIKVNRCLDAPVV